MSQYLVNRGEPQRYRFQSIEDLLEISTRCDYAPEEDGARTECGSFLEDWKQNISTTLLQQLAHIDVPSPGVSRMLEQLSRNRICDPCQLEAFDDDASYTRYCSQLSRKWHTKIWEEYLKENEVNPATVSVPVPTTSSVLSWKSALDSLKGNNRQHSLPLALRNKKKQEDPGKGGRPSGKTPPITESPNEGAKDGITTSIARDGLVFTEDGTSDGSKTMPTATQKPNRPPIQRESATTHIPKIPDKLSHDGYEEPPVSSRDEQRTPVKTRTSSGLSESVSSPESEWSLPPSTGFDRDASSEPDTPLSTSEIPSPDGQVATPSKGKGARGRQKGPNDKSRPPIDLDKSGSAANGQEPKQRKKGATRANENHTPTKESSKGKHNQSVLVTEQNAGRNEEDALVAAPTVLLKPVHAFFKYSDDTNIFNYGLEKIRKPLAVSRLAPGYVYCYRHKEHPGYLKIGSAICPKRNKSNVTGWDISSWKIPGRKNPSWKRFYHEPEDHLPYQVPKAVEDRHTHFENTCEYKAVHVFSYSMPCAALKMESLVHAELRASRYRVSNCNPNKPCKTKHDEWFEVTEAAAREAVLRWRRFSSCEPYDKYGKLKSEWEEAAKDILDKKASGSAKDLAAWIEAQMTAFSDGIGEAAMSANRQAKKELITGARNVAALFNQDDMIGKLKKAKTVFL